MGSEMCIRDRDRADGARLRGAAAGPLAPARLSGDSADGPGRSGLDLAGIEAPPMHIAVSYTHLTLPTIYSV